MIDDSENEENRVDVRFEKASEICRQDFLSILS